MTLKEIITSEEFLKKNKNYCTGEEEMDYLNNYSQTVLNMLTVKDGTGHAGSFAIWSVEIASVAGLDVPLGREIANIFQRKALDSKHIQGKGGYKESPWYKICELRYNLNYHLSFEDLKCQINDILREEENNSESEDLDRDGFTPPEDDLY